MKVLFYASATENLTFYKFFNQSKNSFESKIFVSIKTSLTIFINCVLIVINEISKKNNLIYNPYNILNEHFFLTHSAPQHFIGDNICDEAR